MGIFRSWNETLNQFIMNADGNYYYSDGNGYGYPPPETEFKWSNSEKFMLGEDNPLYEGDVVTAIFYNGEEITGVLKLGLKRWLISKGTKYDVDKMWGNTRFIKIGNIHQNKNILKELVLL